MPKMKARAVQNDGGNGTEKPRQRIPPVYGVRTDIPPEVACALSEGQVSLAWTPAEGVVCLATAKRGNDNSSSQAALANL